MRCGLVFRCSRQGMYKCCYACAVQCKNRCANNPARCGQVMSDREPSEVDGDALRNLRAETGLSRKEAARKIEVTANTLGEWERGRVTPRGENVDAICRAYNCEPGRFVRKWKG